MRLRSLSLPIFLLLPLIACGDKGDGGGGNNGPVDADNDGVPASEDCDDDNPDRYPGNEETWYDGVDGDCEGGNDYDADGDGVGTPDDCDDDDPGVNPVAEEIWYDGVDQDCDNGNDYDADRDGFDSDEYGGSDCDDSDPSIFPDAPDDWYDGVDANCDGASDYDQDGDGFDRDTDGGQDCDDEDEDINPEAEEIWYDGVDQDCAGDNDNDADADGYDATEAGGDDCVDTDPDAYPGAIEQIDGHDTDCDGTEDHYSVEGNYGGSSILGVDEDAAFGSAVAASDLDGDGLDDLAVAQQYDLSTSAAGDGLVWIFNATDVASTVNTTAATSSLATTESSGVVSELLFIDDVDASGTTELVVGAPWAINSVDTGDGAQDLSTGSVWIFDTGALSSATDLSDGHWALWGTQEDGWFGHATAPVDDIDGDGVAELAISAPGEQGDDGTVYVFFSGTLASSGSLADEDADITWAASEDSSVRAGWALSSMGDVNGDGRGDLAVGAPGRCGAAVGTGGRAWIMVGATTAGGDLSSGAWSTINGGHVGISAGSGLASGDMDGDGVMDLAVGAACQDTQAGRVHAVAGADMAAGTTSLDTVSFASYTGYPVFAGAGSVVASGGDVSGDGLADILIGGPGESSGGADAGAAWLVVGGSGTESLNNADASFTGSSADDQAGAALALGDIDGDGLDDLLFGVPGEDTLGDEGTLYIGFSGY